MRRRRLSILSLIAFALLAIATSGALASPVNLGSAGPDHYAVLGLGGQGGAARTDVQFTAKGNVTGNIGIPANGDILASGQTNVTGTVYMNTAGSAHKTGGATITGGIVQSASEDTILRQAVTDALAASTAAAAMTGTPTAIPDANTTITAAHSGVNVLSITNIVLTGHTLTLNAPLGSSFVLNVTGDVRLNSSAQIAIAGGIRPTDVLINVLGTGSDVTATGGTKENTYCIYGVVLAPKRGVSLTGSPITGELIAGGATIKMTDCGGVNDPGLPVDALSLTLAPPVVYGSASSTATVTLSAPAPAGGTTVTLSSNKTANGVTVPATVLVPATSTSATFTVSTKLTPSQVIATISAAVGAGAPVTAQLTVNPITATLSLNPATVLGGKPSTGTITLSAAAPATANIPLTLTGTTAATVPATAQVLNGQTTASFTIPTTIVPATATAHISASYNGSAPSADLTITPLLIQSVTLNPSTVTGGSSSTGTVTLNAPAPSAITVALSSDNAAATLPLTTIPIAANSSTATFTVNTNTVTTTTVANITASYNGSSQSAALTINPPAINLLSLTVSPSTVEGAAGSTGTVTISSAAPAGGVTIAVSSDKSAQGIAPQSNSVTVQQGATTASFPIKTVAVSSSVTATISASLTGTTRTAPLTVTPPTVSVALNPATVFGGYPSAGTVTLSSKAPAGGLTVNLSSDKSGVTVSSSTVVVPADATTASFTVNTQLVPNQVIATISASAGAAAPATAVLTVNPITATVSLNPSTVLGGTSSTGTVTLNNPVASAQTIAISVSGPGASSVGSIANVSIAASGATGTFTVPTSIVPAQTTATITASFNGGTPSATLTITPLLIQSLTLAPTSVTGGSNSVATVTLNANAPADVTITPSSDNIAAGFASAPIIVHAGSNSTTFTVSTIAVSAITTANITASYNGSSQSAPLTINPPALTLAIAAPKSVVGGNPIAATLTLNGPAPANYSVDLTSSDPAAQPSTPVSFPVGSTSQPVTINTSIVAASKTATITATPATGAPATDTLTVLPNALSLSLNASSVVGGQGVDGTLTLAQPVASDLSVTLSGSGPSTPSPASVTILAGQTTASVHVNTVAVSVDTATTITATAGALTASAPLTVTAPTVSVALNPTTVIGGNTSAGTVTLSSPAPGGGLTVSLSSDQTANGVTFSSSSVIVPANTTTAQFTVNTQIVPAQVIATISASNGAAVPATATLTVNPILATVSLNPTAVLGGTVSTGTVTLSSPAPSPLSIPITVSGPGASSVGAIANVSIAANGTAGTFTVPTSIVPAQTTAVITATFNGGTPSATLTITPLLIQSLTLAPASVIGGSSSTATVTLNANAPSDVTISLSSDNGAATLASSTVVIASGSNFATFTVNTSPVTTATAANISAGYNGSSQSAPLSIQPAPIDLLSVTVAPATIVGTQTATGTVTLTRVADVNTVVGLISDTTGVTVPVSVTVPAGSATASFTISTLLVTAPVTPIITGTLGATSKTGTLTVQPYAVTAITVSPSEVTGGNPSGGTVTINALAPVGGIVVSLSSDIAAAVPVATVTVPANSTTATFGITTTTVPSTAVAHITASYNGAGKSAPLTIDAQACAPALPVSLTFSGATGTLTLNGPAISGGETVAVKSSIPGVVCPATVFIPEGQTTGTLILANYAAAPVGTTITATYRGVSVSGQAVLPSSAPAITAGPSQTVCGPMDVELVIDNTGSMDTALAAVKSSIKTVVDQIVQVSGGNYRIGVIRFYDYIDVMKPLTAGDADAVKTLVGTMTANGGNGTPEASDVAVLAAVDQVPASYWIPGGVLQGSGGAITNPTGTLQTGNNTAGWNPGAAKIVVLVTDAPPAEFNDRFAVTSLSQAYAHYVAQEAVYKGVQISAVNCASVETDIKNIMLDYANTSGGVYTFAQGGVGADKALTGIVTKCGTSVGQLTGDGVYVRDDVAREVLPRTKPRTFTTDYGLLTVTNTQPVTLSTDATGFDLTGVSGTVTAARFMRSGESSANGLGVYDFQYGVAALTTSLGSYSAAISSSAMAATSQPYTVSWDAGTDYLSDITLGLGIVYRTRLADRVSSVCGPLSVSDQPQKDFPAGKNILQVKVSGSSLSVAPGRTQDMTLPQSDSPINGTWDIVRNGQVVGASGAPNGWDVEPDHNAYSGVIVTAPASAVGGVSYKVRYNGQAGYILGATTGGWSSAPQMLPITLSSQSVPGGGNVTATITLDAPAPPSGATVTLTSLSSTVTVPPFVKINAGETTATFTINTSAVATLVTGIVQAEYNGYRQAKVGVIGQDGCGAPGIPAQVAVASQNGQAVVTWSAPTGQYKPTGYIISRSDSKAGPYEQVFVTDANTTSYVDVDVVNGQTYYYTITAITYCGQSDPTSPVSGTPSSGTVATPVITPGGGTFSSSQSVTLADATPGAAIYYTMDGSDPGNTSSLYDPYVPLTVSGSARIKARAYLPGWIPSGVAVADFTITQSTTTGVVPVECGSSLKAQAISASSPWSIVQGQGFYAAHFSLAGNAGDTKTITVSNAKVSATDATPFDTTLYLLDPSGNVVASNDDFGGSINPQISYTLQTSGTFIIEVTTFQAGAKGIFDLSVDCSGTGTTTPQIEVSAGGKKLASNDTLDFGQAPAGGKVTQAVTLRNTGNGVLSISGIALNATAFSVTQGPASPLQPGDSTTISIQYNGAYDPTSPTLTINSNDPVTPAFTIKLTGTPNTSGNVGSVPQGGSASFGLSYQSNTPAGGWYVVDPKNVVVGSSDPAYGQPNGWSVSLSGTTVTVGAPLNAVVATGYTVYLSQITSSGNTGLFQVVRRADPVPPTNLTAVAGASQVTLTWTAGVNADSYNVYRGTSAGGESSTPIATGVTATTYTDTTALNGTAYYYKVSSVNVAQGGASPVTVEKGYSNEAAATPSGTAPANGIGLRGDYFNNGALTNPFAAERIDPQINFSSISLPSGVTSFSNFSIRWTGQIEAPVNGATTLKFTYNSGTRIWFNNQQVLNDWSNTTFKSAVSLGTFTLQAGQKYNVRIEEHATNTGMSAQLFWSYPGQSTAVIIPSLYLYPDQGSDAAPLAPTALTTQAGIGSVTLSWTKSANAVSYNVYRSTSATNGFATIGSTNDPTATLVDNGVTNGTTYYYYVTAVNPAGESDPSNIASALPTDGSGLLTGTPQPSSSINLTNDGPTDWIFWGYNSGVVQRKATGGNQISTYSLIGATTTSTTSGNSFNWTDGTPVTTGNGSNAPYVNVANSGFSISAPADSTLRRLNFYVGGSGCTLRAHLSDGSAPDYVDSSVTSGYYTLIYRAGSAGQTLNLTWTTASGYAYVQAASLATGTAIVAPPTSLKAQAGNAKVYLTWTASPVSGVTYTLYRGTSAGTEDLANPIATGLTVLKYTDIGLTNGAPYFYKVAAAYQGLTSALSNEASATPQAYPDPATALVATAGNAKAVLTWTAGAGATSYDLYRGTSYSGSESFYKSGLTGTTYTDTGLTNGTTYFYKLLAKNGSLTSVDASGAALYSNEASATPNAVPAAPVLTAVAGNGSVALNWTTSTGATGYTIARGTTAGGPYTVTVNVVAQGGSGYSGYPGSGSAPATQTYTDTSVTNGTTYYYIVTANGVAGSSAPSNEASATPSQLIVPTPVISATAKATSTSPVVVVPDGGYFNGTLTVTLTDADTAATILYTIDGSDPSAAGNAAAKTYTASFTSTATIPVRAYAKRTNFTASTVTSALFNKNFAPTVQITAPLAGAQIRVGGSVVVTATATDTADPSGHGAIAQVDFYETPAGAGAPVKIGSAKSLPYTVNWIQPAVGTYTLTATAVDNDGGSATATESVSIVGGLTVGAIDCDGTVHAALDANDGTSVAQGTGHYADQYTFTPATDEWIVVSMTASQPTSLDTYLSIYAKTNPVAGDTAAAYNDDSLNQTSNSQIVYKVTGGTTYTIEATSLAPYQTGGYTLTLRCSAAKPAAGISVTTPGTDGTPQPVASGSLITLGPTPKNVAATQQFTLTNTGLQDLALSGLAIAPGTFGLSTALPPLVPAGQSVTFTLGFQSATVGTTTGTFSLSNTSPTNPFTLSLSGSVLSDTASQVAVTAIAFNPSSVISGKQTVGTITLAGPAPNGGQLVSLHSANNTVFPLPPSVTVPAGQASYTFTVTAGPVSINHNTAVTAYTGPSTGTLSQATTTVTIIVPGPPPVVSITSPAAGATVSVGQVPVTAAAAPATGGAPISKVDFFATPTGGTQTAIGQATASPYTINWQATAGTYQLTAIATDNNGVTATSAPISVTVSTQPSATAPTISATSNTGAALAVGGTSVGYATITLTNTFTPNPAEPVGIFYTTDGTAPDPVTSPRYTGPFRIVALPATPTDPSPTVTVQAIAMAQGYLNSTVKSAGYKLTPAAKLAAPTAVITSPADGGEAMGQAPITGIASGPAFAGWQLAYRDVSDTSGHWTQFAVSTTQTTTSGPLKVADPLNPGTTKALLWDTSLMMDGQYELRLTVFDTDGQTATDNSYVVVKGHQKIGYMTLSYTDMTIPIAGIPISITRTYDSRDKTAGDFGVGWKLSTTNVKVQKPEISAFNWEQVQYGGGFGLTYVLQPIRAHNVTIVLPGDQVYSFQEQVNPNQSQYQAFADALDTHVVYQQLSGPRATLTPLDSFGNALSTDVFVQSADATVKVNGINDPNAFNSDGGNNKAVQLYEGDLETPYNPGGFILTLHNGTQYKVDTSGNLISITDRNGNEVDFGPGGISSKDGRTISFTHIGNTITGITDMMGHTFHYAQDGQGNLASTTDRIGNTTTYDYDPEHNLTGIHNALGIMPVRNYYYPDGRLNYTLDAQNHEIDQYYDPAIEPGGRVPPANSPVTNVTANTEVISDALGGLTVAQYDAYGNVTSSTSYVTQYYDGVAGNKKGITTQKSYQDPANPSLPTSVTNSLSKTITYVYDVFGQITSSTDPLGNKTTFQYDTFGNLLKKINPDGTLDENNVYDQGLLVSTTDPTGAKTTYQYNSSGLLKTQTDARGNSTTYTYDDAGQIASVTDPYGHTSQYTRDKNGNVIARQNAVTHNNGKVETVTTLIQFDEDDNVVQTTTPDGANWRVHYNSIGKIESSVDPLGKITRFEYDDYGKRSATTRPNGKRIETVYDALGRVSEQRTPHIDEHGNVNMLVTRTLYDEMGRSYAVEQWQGIPGASGSIRLSKTYNNYDALGQTTSAVDATGVRTGLSFYDDDGNIVQRVDALGSVTNFAYDKLGRVTQVTDAMNHSVSMVYDNDGRISNTGQEIRGYDQIGEPTSIITPGGLKTVLGFDNSGNHVETYNPGGNRTQYVYDELGRIVKQIDALGHTTLFDHDSLGHITSRTLPLGQTETYQYNPDGSLAIYTDFNGHSVSYQYDSTTGSLISKSGFDGIVSYTYWPDGLRKSATKNGIVTNYFWDIRNRLVRVEEVNGSLNYTYDDNGKKTSVSYEDTNGNLKWKTQYKYDVCGRMTTVIHPDLTVSTYEYDKSGNVTLRTLANGVTTKYLYDASNFLLSVDNSVGGNFDSFVNPDGKRVSIAADEIIQNLTYDACGYLSSSGSTSGNISYTYDAVGNRRTKTVQGVQTNYYYDDNDRLIQEETNGNVVNYKYDNNGNLTLVNSPTKSVSLKYDFENKLVIYSGGDSQVEYTYDASGNRVSKIIGSEHVGYVIDVVGAYPNVVEEIDQNSGIPIVRYDYGLSPLRVDEAGISRYFVQNIHGDTVALIDASGSVSDRYTFNVDGSPIHTIGTSANSLLYYGQQFDSETGYYYLRARYYDPSIGRFIAQDVFEGYRDDPVSLNKYVYASNDPINNVDPSGNETLAEMVTVTGNLATLIKNVLSVYNSANKAYQTVQEIKTVLEYYQIVADIIDAYVSNGEVAAADAIAKAVQKELGIDVTSVPSFFGSFRSMFDNIGKHWGDAVEAIEDKAPDMAANAIKYLPKDLGVWKGFLEKGTGGAGFVFILPSTPLKYKGSATRYIKVKYHNESMYLALQIGGGAFFGVGVHRTSNSSGQTLNETIIRIDYWDYTMTKPNPFLHYHLWQNAADPTTNDPHWPIWDPIHGAY